MTASHTAEPALPAASAGSNSALQDQLAAEVAAAGLAQLFYVPEDPPFDVALRVEMTSTWLRSSARFRRMRITSCVRESDKVDASGPGAQVAPTVISTLLGQGSTDPQGS